MALAWLQFSYCTPVYFQYANRAITTVYTNRNTHRNFIQKSENHTPSLWLRIFSSFTSCSSSILSCMALCSSNSCLSLAMQSSSSWRSWARHSGDISALNTVFCSASTIHVTGTGHWHHDFQFLWLAVLQFSERKNRFREDCSCFLDNANSHQALQFDSWQFLKTNFLRYK